MVESQSQKTKLRGTDRHDTNRLHRTLARKRFSQLRGRVAELSEIVATHTASSFTTTVRTKKDGSIVSVANRAKQGVELTAATTLAAAFMCVNSASEVADSLFFGLTRSCDGPTRNKRDDLVCTW